MNIGLISNNMRQLRFSLCQLLIGLMSFNRFFKFLKSDSLYSPYEWASLCPEKKFNEKVFDSLIANTNTALKKFDHSLFVQYCLLIILYFYFEHNVKIEKVGTLEFVSYSFIAKIFVSVIFFISIYTAMVYYFINVRIAMLKSYIGEFYKPVMQATFFYSFLQFSSLTIYYDIICYKYTSFIKSIIVNIILATLSFVYTIPSFLSLILFYSYTPNGPAMFFPFYIFVIINIFLLLMFATLTFIMASFK